MAKPLRERIASALSTDRTTIETLSRLVDDIAAERDRLATAHKSASADSIDFALDDEARELAAGNAARYGRSLEALATVAAEIQSRLEAKQTSETQLAKRAEREAALAERDEIAARFAERVPAIVSELVAIIAAVEANAKRMRAAGVHELDAEAKARGIGGNGYFGVSPASLFTKMPIPNFEGPGRCWPVEVTIKPFDYVGEKRAAAEAAKAQASKLAAQRAERKRIAGTYRVESLNGEAVRFETENGPEAAGPWNAWTGTLAHDAAKAIGMKPAARVTYLEGAE